MSNDYIKRAELATIFEMAKPFLEEAGRLTDKSEKMVELYKPQMKSVDEIVPLTDLFFSDFPELTDAEREVMAGETVPVVLEAFKAKLEAMTDEEFVTENIFLQIKAVQKETGIKGKNLFMPIRIAVSGIHVRTRTGNHAGGEGGGVELMFRIQNQRNVHGFHLRFGRAFAVQQVQEVTADGVFFAFDVDAFAVV